MRTTWLLGLAGAALPRRTTAVILALVLGLSMASCSGEEKESPKAPQAGGGGSGQVKAAPLVALPGRVSGTLPKARRKHVAVTVGKVVDRWFRAGYLGGPFPRSSFKNSFAVFSPRLRKQAVSDRKLLTNAAIGPRIDGVVARRRLVLVDLLAPRGRIAGATARVKLWFDTTGSVEQRIVIRGTLTLTRTPKGGYQVFGYDVDRAAIPLPLKKPGTKKPGTKKPGRQARKKTAGAAEGTER
ncbi:MAG: hypothetical protein L0H93_17030 [Nocardioides sp.]|nr:hypothetical protein [Nocardioides sp.]